MAEHSVRKKRSHAKDRQNLDNHVLPKWTHRPYDSIKRSDVIELVEGLVTRGFHTLANRIQSLISSIFTFGMDAGLIEFNPCSRLRKRGVERVGQRVLADHELRLFWSGIVDPPSVKLTGLGLRLALLTGARRSEVVGMNRAELLDIADPDRAAWIIPGSRTKNEREHLIPLSRSSRSIVLDLLALIDKDEQFLFPTRSLSRNGQMQGNSLTQAMANFCGRLKGDSDAERTWRADAPTPHDLRRTVETRLASLGVVKEHRDAVLNHVTPGVGAKHYNRHDFEPEKRAALNRWDLVLESILNTRSAVVVPLARVGAA